MRKFVVLITLFYAATVGGFLWFLSDGFREALLYGQSVIVTTLVASVAATVVVALMAWWKDNEWLAVLLVGIIVGSGWYVADTHHGAYGEWFPNWTSSAETSGIAALGTKSGKITYHLDLLNPGTVSHREYLFVRRGEQESRIRLPVFEEKRSGYISAKKPEDWIKLRTTENPDEYRAEIGAFLFVKKAFRVNLRTKKVAPTD